MIRVLIIIAIAAMILWAIRAHAQGAGPDVGECGPRPAVVMFFSQRFAGEHQIPQVEVTKEGQTTVEFVTTRSSWYRLATRPPGITCIVGMGLRT